MAKGEHKKVNRPKQDGYEILLNPGDYKVTRAQVRFGTLDGNGNHEWGNRTMAMEPIEINQSNQGPNETVAIVDADQLPAAATDTYYQLLCVIPNAEGEDETLVTEATKLA
jgi:hypothetical protein